MITVINAQLPARVVRWLSVESQTDPRTVSRVLNRKPTREATRVRIEAALRKFAKQFNDKLGAR